MSSGRRFEYEKGPRLEDEGPPPDGDGSADEGTEDSSDGGRRATAVVAPWRAGAVAGASAFAVAFAAIYQLAAAMDAGGAFGRTENEPSRLVIAGLLDAASHGATIEYGGEPIERAFAVTGGFASHVTPLIPAVVLLAAGYLLVRYARLETRRGAGLAVGSLVVCYVVPTVALASVARWTPEGGPGGTQGGETIAAATDLSLLVSVAGTALVFAAIGAAVAALPQLLEAGPSDAA